MAADAMNYCFVPRFLSEVGGTEPFLPVLRSGDSHRCICLAGEAGSGDKAFYANVTSIEEPVVIFMRR